MELISPAGTCLCMPGFESPWHGTCGLEVISTATPSQGRQSQSNPHSLRTPAYPIVPPTCVLSHKVAKLPWVQ